jgi:uncharacterized SAM-binding protein YcdF (DUF218 family)
MRFVVSVLVTALACAVLSAIALAVQIWTFDAQLRAPAPLDAAIVLGAAAPAGTPSPVFAARLDYGRELWQRGAVRFVIVTGGGRDDPTNPEAVAGRRYLVAGGVPASKVLFETSSKTTPENLCFARAVGRARGLRTYAIVSDPFHVARAMRYAADLGIQAWPAATPYTKYLGLHTRLPFLLRETYLYGERMATGPTLCPP